MDYSKKTIIELKQICKDNNISGISKKNKKQLLELINKNIEKIQSKKDNVNNIIKKSEALLNEYKIKTSININLPLREEISTNVLTLCEIPKSLDIQRIKILISEYIEPRKKYYKSKKRSPFIEDEFSEFYTAETTGGQEIGSGNCAMDVKTKLNEGIDAMCVIMNKGQSNEKSLMQNFSDSGNNLDKLFFEKNDKEAVELYIKGYSEKLIKCKNEKGLIELYILAFISTNIDIYLVCFTINIENIENCYSGGFVNPKKDSCVNIIVNNFINKKYGKVNLYKSKKRLELRLLPSILTCKESIKIYTMN